MRVVPRSVAPLSVEGELRCVCVRACVCVCVYESEGVSV